MTNEVDILAAQAKDMEELLNNEQYKKNAVDSAVQIHAEFPDWFEPKKLTKVFNVSLDEVFRKLETLIAFKLCVCKRIRNKPHFRIDLDKKVQRRLLNDLLEKKGQEVKILKEKLSNLD